MTGDNSGSDDKDDPKTLAAQREEVKEEDAQIAKLQGQVDTTTKVMQENMQLLLDRGDQIQDLQKEADELQAESQVFRRTATRIKWYEEINNALMTLVLVGFALGIAYAAFQGYSLVNVALIGIGSGAGSFALSRVVLGIFHWLQDRAQRLNPEPREDLTSRAHVEFDRSQVLDNRRSLTNLLDLEKGRQPGFSNVVPFKTRAELEADKREKERPKSRL